MSTSHRSERSEHNHLHSFQFVPALAVALMLLAHAPAVVAQTSQVSNLNGDCGAATAKQEWNCTASDIAISEITNILVEGNPTYCVEGQPLLIEEATVSYSINRQNVYDPTMFVGDQQGTDPRLFAGPGQTCSAFSLPGPFVVPPDIPSLANPWTDLDGDACGDSAVSVSSASRRFTDLPVTCQDNDGDGKLDLQVLLTWSQNAGAACGTGVGQTFPTRDGYPSKCDYSLRQTNLDVVPPGTLTVIKNTIGGNDAFNFGWSSSNNNAVQFSLDTSTGGGTAQASYQIIDGLGDTDFNVAEILTEEQIQDGWSFVSAQCLDQDQNEVGTFTDGGSSNFRAIGQITIESGDAVTCTFTNAAPASLTVVKNTLGGNGVFEFTSDVPGLTPTFQLDTGAVNTAQVTVDNIPIADPDNGASFTITENLPEGWQLVSASCDGQPSATGSVDVTLRPGQAVTCTFTNGLEGSLTIVKNTLGGDGSFDFTSDLPGVPGGQFNITTSNNTGARVFSNALPEGTYSVTEVVPAGWDLTGLACVEDGEQNSSTDLGSATATINIEIGESVTCTYTNTQRGIVEIVKATAPTGGTGFTFVSEIWNNQQLPLDDGQTHTATDLVPGQYTVTETDPAPAFDLSGLVCVDSATGGTASTVDLGTRQATINLDPGETVTCTFTNTQRGSITIVKSVSADGPLVTDFNFSSPDFGAFVLGPVTVGNPDQSTQDNLVPGTYSVSEDDPTANGWALTGASCNDGSNPSAIDLAPGEDVVCNFVNSPLGSATIIKFTVGDDDTFNYVGSDPFDGLALTTIGGAASADFTFQLLPSNNPHTITEDPLPAGWSLTGLGCVEDGTLDSTEDLASRTATINVDLNEEVTCTFTNTAGSTLIIRKETLPDGVDQPFTFDGEASGSIRDYSAFSEQIVVSGQPGIYSSAELVPEGWTVTGIACSGAINSIVTIGDAGGFDDGDEAVSVDLAAGETVVCSFENTSEGGITIVKETVGDAGQFAFSSGLGNFVIDTAVDPDVAFSDLLPGSYLFSETVPAGWELTDIACTGATSSTITIGGSGGFEPGDQGVTIDLQDGELIICTFQNTQLVPDITIVKTPSPTTFAAVDEVITYTLEVTNTGTAPLTDILVEDPLPGLSAIDCAPQTNPIVNLAPGATVTCTATLTTTQPQLDAGRIDNTASATGSSPTGTDDVTDSASATVSSSQQPNIRIVKTPNPNNYGAPGEIITYTLEVTNSGNTTLSNVDVSDPLPDLAAIDCGTEANPIADLAPGETVICTTTLTTTQAHVDAGQIVNTATATGSSPDNVNDVTDSDSANVNSVALAAINITKTPSLASFAAVGEVITYTLVVTNNGGVTLSNVLVADPLPGLSAIDCGAESNPIADLGPGEAATCTASLTVTQAHIDAGQIDNTARAAGSPPGDAADVSDTASAVVPANQNPLLAVEKSSSTALVTAAGQVIDYSYVVTNIGNVTLSNVMLADNNVDAAPACDPAAPATLAPTEVMSCTAVHTVTADEFKNLESIDNVATATSDLAAPVTDSLSIPVESVQPTAPIAIPSLDRYGLAILALLVLGLAALTFRRFG
jgi:uncharacterized repeat protein (TIGR01451 family)